MQRYLPIQDEFVLISLSRSANITEFKKNIVFLVGLERVGAPFLCCSYTEERLPTTLASPVVDDKLTINKQLLNQTVHVGPTMKIEPYLRSTSHSQTKFEIDIVRARLQLATQPHRPPASDVLRCRSSKERLCLVNQEFLEHVIQWLHAVVINVTMPRNDPAASAVLSEHIVIERRHQNTC